jgi:hypothetical protein
MITAFTVHLALRLRIKMDAGLLQRGRGLWKMKTSVIEDATNRSRIQQEWIRWRLRKENTWTWLRGGRNMLERKSFSFSSNNFLQRLEKIL